MKTKHYLLLVMTMAMTFVACGNKTNSDGNDQDSALNVATDTIAAGAVESADTMPQQPKDYSEEIAPLVAEWIGNEAIHLHMTKEFKKVCASTNYLPWGIMSEGEEYKYEVRNVKVVKQAENVYHAKVADRLTWASDGEPNDHEFTIIVVEEDGKWCFDDYILEDGKMLKHEIKAHGYGQTL